MHGPINVKSPNNTSKWQMGFNSAFEGLKKIKMWMWSEWAACGLEYGLRDGYFEVGTNRRNGKRWRISRFKWNLLVTAASYLWQNVTFLVKLPRSEFLFSYELKLEVRKHVQNTDFTAWKVGIL